MRTRRESGIVLPLVLIIGMLLTAAIATFIRRAVVDKMVVDNRDAAAAAATLARGGVQLATAVLFHDQYEKELERIDGLEPGSTLDDLWAKLRTTKLTTQWGGELRLRIEDSGARFNLNALVPSDPNPTASQASPEAEEFLVEFLRRVIDDRELEKKNKRRYDERELARNLLDYIDADDVAISGRDENEYYRRQDPPYEAPNRPILSIEEIGMIEGFDVELAEALRPYVTVHPLVGDEGINLNTAPPHVLGLIYFGSTGDMVLADADIVGGIMKERDQDRIVCTDTARVPDRCVPLGDVGLGLGAVYPELDLPAQSTVFTVESEARVGEVVYTVEAVIDVSNGEEPLLLSWRAL